MSERLPRNDGHDESELEAALGVLSRLAGSPDTAIRIETADLGQVRANECFRRLFGGDWEPDDRLLYPEAFHTRVEAVRRQRDFVSGDPVPLADGRLLERDYLPLDVNGIPGGAAWIYRDPSDGVDRTTNRIPRATVDRTLDQVFNALPYACTIVGIADGRFLNANDAFCQGFGFERSEVIGRTSVELGLWVNVEDRERLIRRALAAGFLHEAQIDARTKTGDRKTVLLSVERIERPDGVCLLAIWNDVTERVAAQTALLRRDAQLRRLVDANPLGVFFSDFSGAITEANAAFLDMIGYAREDVEEGRLNWLSLTAPEFMDVNAQADEQARRAGVFEPFEKEYIRRDGTRVPVLVGGVLFDGGRESGDGIDFVLDLSERKRTEAALRESEARYRTIFESCLTGNYISSPDGRLLACNETFARIYGFATVEEALSCDMGSLYASASDRAVFLELLCRERKLARYEFESRRCDGSVLHTVDFIEGVFDKEGALVEIHGSCFDDTQRRGLEDQLRQSQKMEAVGRLAGGVAHDFNNLLTVISGYSAFLVSGLAPGDHLREHAVEIHSASERAAGLTRQLLAFSRKQLLQPKIVSLNALVENLQRMLVRLIGEDVELCTELDPELPNVEADPGQIEQVLVNLAVNARDAMPGGGRLTIATRSTTRDMGSRVARSVAEIVVRDTGCGMDERTRARAFEPFFTTKGAGQGTGLGLSTVYGIVEQSNGTIEVESLRGHGSTFRIHLPAVDDAIPVTDEHGAEAEAARGIETILLVEDEESVRGLVSSVLRSHGYRVLEAADGMAALNTAEQCPGPIALVVTDVVMPHMNGRIVVERLRAARPGTKALFISGYTEDDVLRCGLSEDHSAFLAKPFSPNDLVKKVRLVIDAQ